MTSSISAFSVLSALSVVDRKCYVPEKRGEVKPKLFKLCQLARGTPGVSDKFESLRGLFEEWWRLSCGGCVGLGSHDTLWAIFLDGLDRVKFPSGVNPIEEAWRRSGEVTAPEASRFTDPRICRLVSWFCELQKLHPSGAIFLSTRDIGKKLNVDPKEAWIWCRSLLELEGILFCVLRGNPHKATRYRYVPLCGATSPTEPSEWDLGDEQGDGEPIPSCEERSGNEEHDASPAISSDLEPFQGGEVFI